MAEFKMDLKGLKCPQPVLKIAAKVPEMKPDDILIAEADCPTFEDDVRKWCARMKKNLLGIEIRGSAKIAKIEF